MLLNSPLCPRQYLYANMADSDRRGGMPITASGVGRDSEAQSAAVRLMSFTATAEPLNQGSAYRGFNTLSSARCIMDMRLTV